MRRNLVRWVLIGLLSVSATFGSTIQNHRVGTPTVQSHDPGDGSGGGG